jgi:hypothetical protein
MSNLIEHALLLPVTTSSVSQLLAFDTSILAGQLSPSSVRAYLSFAGGAAEALIPSTLARWRTYLANEIELSPNTIKVSNNGWNWLSRNCCESW